MAETVTFVSAWGFETVRTIVGASTAEGLLFCDCRQAPCRTLGACWGHEDPRS